MSTGSTTRESPVVLGTHFASPERTSGDPLAAELEHVAKSHVVDALLRGIGTALFVLNENRQLLAANDASLRLLGLRDPSTVLGLRPGEALRCVRAHEEVAGCGTSRGCATCGAVLSILLALRRGRPEERNCALAFEGPGGVDEREFRVRAAPFDLEGRRLLLVTMTDVSHQTRHAAMERAFLHDISNVLAGLAAAAEAVSGTDPWEMAEAVSDVRLISERLVREVQLQRMLTSQVPERYRPSSAAVCCGRLCEDLHRFFHRHPIAAGRTLELGSPERPVVHTDEFLLARVLTNLLKNAFEATVPGGRVRLSVRAAGPDTLFEVHNPGAIPAAVVPRIFQRHFSTKPGAGRGEGTWSVKVLGERMLRGRVGFDTHPVAGTTFWLRLPEAEPAAG